MNEEEPGRRHTEPKRLFAVRNCAVALLSIVAGADAQSGGGYLIKKFAIKCGGGIATDGSYRLSGTVGQHDAAFVGGGGYGLTGGLWSPASSLKPHAACCLSDGMTCSVTDQVSCEGMGGYYLGPPLRFPAVTECVPPAPTCATSAGAGCCDLFTGDGCGTCQIGSCCAGGGGCVELLLSPVQRMTKVGCDSLSGAYVGGIRCHGGSCSNHPLHSCARDEDCPLADICVGTEEQLSQPSPCLRSSPPAACGNDFELASNGAGGDRLSRFGCVSALEPPPAAAGAGTAIRVRLRTLYNTSGSDPDGASQCIDRALLTTPQPSLSQFETQTRWLGAPGEAVDEATPTPPNYIAAPLVCAPEEAAVRDWSPAGLAATFGGDADDTRVYFYDSAVVPCSVYEVSQCSDPLDESTCSEPVLIFTSRMADAWPPFDAAGQPSFTDINALVNKFKGIPFAPGDPPLGGVPEWHSLLKGNVVGDYDVTIDGRKVGFLDIGVSVDGFKGLPYREQGPCNAGTGFDNCGHACTTP